MTGHDLIAKPLHFSLNQKTNFCSAAEIAFFFQFYSSSSKMKDQSLICS